MLLVLLLLLFLQITKGGDCETQLPLKVFLLVGQSNMQGHGMVDQRSEKTGKPLNGTLEWLVENNPAEYGMLVKTKRLGQLGREIWKERPDVFVAYNHQAIGDIEPKINMFGRLKPGFAGERKQFHMGPEMGFGWTVGDALNGEDGDCRDEAGCDCVQPEQKILLLKVAWGGRSLAEDFRPPSSGRTGVYYLSMIANTLKTLENLGSYFGSSADFDGRYELAGFAW